MNAKPIPPELQVLQKDMERDARNVGLDFFDVIYQVHDYKSISELIAYSGLPSRYPHWSFGKEHMVYRYQYDYGGSKVYEMVINNDPAFAYLMSDNSFTMNKMVMSHVIAHVDFFKMNMWFSQTDRNAVFRMDRDADMVRAYAREKGDVVIEDFIDLCKQLENLIDPMSVFGLPRNPEPQETFDPMENVKPWMRDWVMSPEEREKYEMVRKMMEVQEKNFPRKPTQDILGFLLEHAPRRNRNLEKWQQDIMRMIRDDAYYFAPQRMTKIMNEGWASFWHQKFMSEFGYAGKEGIVDFAKNNAQLLGNAPWNFSPYVVGLLLYEYIQDKWDKGKHGIDFEQCRSVKDRRDWDTGEMGGMEKILQVRAFYDDFLMLNEFFDQEFADKHRLYKYKTDEEGRLIDQYGRPLDREGRLLDPFGRSIRGVFPEPQVESTDHRYMKYGLIQMLDNGGNPYVYVVDGDHKDKGQLMLYHRFDGRPLKISWAQPVMGSISQIWGNDVHLFTWFIFDKKEEKFEPALLTCKDKGAEFFIRKFDMDKNEPTGEKIALG